LIEVWNKVDRLDADGRTRLFNLAERQPSERRPVIVSALTGEGIDRLMQAIKERMGAERVVLEFALDAGDGAGVSWLHRNTEVLGKTVRDDGSVAMTVRVLASQAAAVRSKFAGAGASSRA
jgi:GTP-binding protein HflX